jgi:hypothetical protein
MQANDITMKIQEENNTSDIPNHDHQIKLQHQSRGRTQRTKKENRQDFQMYHIPTQLQNRKQKHGNNIEYSDLYD